MARIAFLVVAMPTQLSSKEGVSFAMVLINSRSLVMVSFVTEEVRTLLTRLSTFCRKNSLHTAAHSVTVLQSFRRGSLSVHPRLSMESARRQAAACRFEASDILSSSLLSAFGRDEQVLRTCFLASCSLRQGRVAPCRASSLPPLSDHVSNQSRDSRVTLSKSMLGRREKIVLVQVVEELFDDYSFQDLRQGRQNRDRPVGYCWEVHQHGTRLDVDIDLK